MLRDQIRERIDFYQKSITESIDGGPSDQKPIDTEAEAEEKALDEARQNLKRSMEEKRVSQASAMNTAEIDQETKAITVTKFSGKLIKNMGRTVTGKRILYPEEALFLMEAAALEIVSNEVPISLGQAYSILIDDRNLSWNQYTTYCHLTRCGYGVVRFQKSIESIGARKLSIAYDVHSPESGFNMTKAQRPEHRLVIMGADDEPLTLDELRLLRSRMGDDVPLHAAIVDQGDVIYFNVDWVVCPRIS